MEVTPRAMQNLVTKAFCLEAIADKQDCTSRYRDLDGRPLEDFVIAGINVGSIFADFARKRLDGERVIFELFPHALEVSNQHKTQKFVNFGLLEIMFPTVAARMANDNPEKVIDEIIELMNTGDSSEVDYLFKAREIAWSTSTKQDRKMKELEAGQQATSPLSFYENILRTSPEDSASYQWAMHYKNGLPWLREQFEYLQSHADKPILQRIEHAFNPLRQSNPDIRIGILADMSAAAIFLHPSYQ